MNIRDIDTTYTSLRTNIENAPENRGVNPGSDEPTDSEYTEFTGTVKSRTAEQQDEYIRSDNTIRNALYNVSDISRNSSRTRVQERIYNPNENEILRKIIDVVLSTGRKSLKVYRKEAL